MAHLKLKIITTYLDVEEEDYLRLGGESLDMRSDSFIQNEPPINETPINEPKIINSSQSFKSNECVICLTNPPNVLFCNCGHLCLCSECDKIKISNKCPICKTENEIIRTLE